MKKPLVKVGIALLIAGGLICASVLEGARPKGFHPRSISSPLEFSPSWEIDVPEIASLIPVLSQDFFYLGSGAQCFALISEDGKYVLKFFKMKHLLPKKWLQYVYFPGLGGYRFRKTERRVARQKSLFQSYKLAWNELREETGLVYLHLNKTNHLKMTPKLFDREGNSFKVDLDRYEFIVQRKSSLVRDHIAFCMHEGEKEKAIKAIHNLLNTVVNVCKKGFIDQDSGVSNNYGFVGDEVIHFDAGQLIADSSVSEPSHYQREVVRVASKLEKWLRQAYPELLPTLEDAVEEIIASTSE